jgi:segregation and condensation protein B
MDELEIRHFLEAALLAAGRPLSVDQLQNLFDGRSMPEKAEVRTAIKSLVDEYEGRGITIAEVASGYRIQVKANMAERLSKLWEERPPRYSRALFETLALVAYRQPVTRGEIEEIRGVAVSSNIVRTLIERDWVRVVGHRDVPGRPEMFGTTRGFLDYFGLMKLDDLPPLADLSDWESLRVQLNLPEVEDDQTADIHDPSELPVLYPEIGVEAEDVGSEGVEEQLSDGIEEQLVVANPSDGDIPELIPIGDAEPLVDEIEDDEDLIIAQWPDPADSTG